MGAGEGGSVQLGLFGGDREAGGVAPAEVGEPVRALAARLPDGVHLGTSSWSFPGWRGLVWRDQHGEAELARRGLAAYARHPLFRTVGVDRTHYAPVAAAVLRDYAAAAGPGFRFLVKAHDHCTTAAFPSHPRYGELRGQPNPRFLDVGYARDLVVAPFVEGLAASRGPLLFQFPPQPAALVGGPRRFAERLYRFLRDLPRGPLYAVELRTPELLGRDYAACLAAIGAVHCINLTPGMPGPLTQWQVAGRDQQPALVVRWLLAPHHDYQSGLTAYHPFDRLVDPDRPARDAIARLVREAGARRIPSWVIVNNKAEGSAPRSIEELARAVVDGEPAPGS